MYLVTETLIDNDECTPSVLCLIKREHTRYYDIKIVRSVETLPPEQYTHVFKTDIIRMFDNEHDAVSWYNRYQTRYENYVQYRSKLARELHALDEMFLVGTNEQDC
jgi:hypothetical protein